MTGPVRLDVMVNGPSPAYTSRPETFVPEEISHDVVVMTFATIIAGSISR
jgi:hypothetical protein